MNPAYRIAPGVVLHEGDPPRATLPEGGTVWLDGRLAGLLRRADGRSLDDVLAGIVREDLTPLVLRAGLACLAEAGLLERTGAAAAREAGPTRGPLVSAVVAGCRGPAAEARVVDSLRGQTHAPIEVIVADPSGGASTARRLYRAVEQARGEHLLFLDEGVRLDPAAVAEMLSVAARDWRCAAVVPKRLRGDAPGFVAGLGCRAEPGSFPDDASGDLDLGQHDEWDCVSAARFDAALVPRAAWREVGPLDEAFPVHEDVEWCFRARALGRHVRAAPRAVATRLDGAWAGAADAGRETEAQLLFAIKLLPVPGALAIVRACAPPRGTVSGWVRAARAAPGALRSRRRLAGRRASFGSAGLGPGGERLELGWDRVLQEYGPLMKEGRTRAMPEWNDARRPVLLVVSHDVVDRRMAGPGIRYLEMAKALAGPIDVVLAVPGETRLEVPGVPIVRYEESVPSSLQVLVDNADAAVVSGYMFAKFPFLAGTSTRLAVDLYDPLVLENLHYYLDDPVEAQDAHNRTAVEVMNAGIRLGDFFLCGTERQRDFWLGVLAANGRVNPRTHDHDRSLRRLIDVVGMGLPSRPPSAGRGLRGRDARLPEDSRIVLWGGGIWNWLDPLTLVRAWPAVVAREPRARLLFLGTRHPNPAVPRHAMAERAEALARETGELDRSIVFVDWVDLEEREALLREAHVGVSLHPQHVETRYSIRARVIDCFWARLPVVVTEGDVASEWVERHGLGRVVAENDADGVARALVEILARPRSDWQASFDAVHEELRWDRVVEPLRRYCLEGAPAAADRRRGSKAAAEGPPPVPMPLLLRALHYWRHEGGVALVRRSLGSARRRAGRG